MLKNKRDNSFSNCMTDIGANKIKTHFTSSKNVKTWTRYLNTNLDLKTRTSRFSSSKRWKTRETILFVISFFELGIYILKSQFSSSKSVKIWGTILLAISLTGKGAYPSKNQFSSSNSVKTWWTILIHLNGIGACMSQSNFSTNYLILKLWSSKFWKTKETILLAISLTEKGAYKRQTQFTSSKSLETWTDIGANKTKTHSTSSKNVKLEHDTWTQTLILILVQVGFQVPKDEKQERQFF